MNVLVQTQMEALAQEVHAFTVRHKKPLMLIAFTMALLMVAGLAMATSTDTWANAGYDFVLAAAKGKFARSICVVGGLVGLMMGAGSGKPILALTGVVLAAFGFLAPTLIDAVFGGALI